MSISPKDSVMEGQKAVLICEGDANPPISQYTWFDWNNQDLHNYDRMLRLDPVNIKHSGAYWCQGTNRLGEGRSPPSTLTIYCKAPFLVSSGLDSSCGFPPKLCVADHLLPIPSLPVLLAQPSPSRSAQRHISAPHTSPIFPPPPTQSLLTLQEDSLSGCPHLPDILSAYWFPPSLSPSVSSLFSCFEIEVFLFFVFKLRVYKHLVKNSNSTKG